MIRRAKPLQPKLRLRDRRRRLLWTKITFFFCLFLFLVGAVALVTRIPNFLLTDVAVVGTSHVDEDAVQALVREKLKGTYYFLVPRANAYALPRAEIIAAITEQFPVVGKVQISQKDPHTLLVTVTERESVALWCATDCYFVDVDGLIFENAQSVSGFTRYRGLIQGGPIGSTFPGFKALKALVGEIERTTGRTAESVTVEINNDTEVVLLNGGALKFVRTDDPTALVDAIASVFNSEDFKKGRSFDYADFRYGNKVYVKFVGQ